MLHRSRKSNTLTFFDKNRTVLYNRRELITEV